MKTFEFIFVYTNKIHQQCILSVLVCFIPLYVWCFDDTDDAGVVNHGNDINLYVLKFSEGTYIYIVCNSSTLILQRYLKSVLT